MNSHAIVPPARVGFIGLGKMGYPMVRRLSGAGYHILAHDLDPKALKRARHATGADAPGPGVDHTAVVQYWENLAGTRLGKK